VAETGCRGISARGQVVMAHGGLHMRPVFRAEEVDDRGQSDRLAGRGERDFHVHVQSMDK
jgi:hypothetical protein